MNTYKAVITVTLRPSILDPEGTAVRHALESLSLPGVQDVRMGKHIAMTVSASSKERASAVVEESCRKLLANPVMADFHYELEKVSEA